jgi:hypothetical protein
MGTSVVHSAVDDARGASCARLLIRTSLAGVAGLALWSAGALIWMTWNNRDPGVQPIEFDAVRWRDAQQSAAPDDFGHTLRQAMASHAIESALPAGMTRQAVRERLGEPSRWPIFGDAVWFGAEDEAWWLGAKSGLFARANEWLYLDFDGADRLVSAQIIEESVSRSRAP